MIIEKVEESHNSEASLNNDDSARLEDLKSEEVNKSEAIFG